MKRGMVQQTRRLAKNDSVSDQDLQLMEIAYSGRSIDIRTIIF